MDELNDALTEGDTLKLDIIARVIAVHGNINQGQLKQIDRLLTSKKSNDRGDRHGD
ncbi:hypothetical protein N9137_01045 [Pseudomonadales bacterium]|nr:hypothetical protein [Pseudomonadales bacterium]